MTDHHTRRSFLKGAGGALAVSPLLCVESIQSRELDTIIRGATVIDGLGGPPLPADVGIRNERIAAIGLPADARAARVIDAPGLTVTPGFIDIHAHTNLIAVPRAESKVFQGVTLDITGPDGGSPFPVRARRGATGPVRSLADCSNFGEWAARHANPGIAINLGAYVGHGTVRGLALGPTSREPDARELELMRGLVRQAMDQGAVGLSSGLEYSPGLFAETPELIALARVAAEFGAFYATHMRSEEEALLDSIDEAIRIGRESGATVLITHFKVGGKPNWHLIDAAIEKIERARAEGVRILCDRYPYTAWSTSLGTSFPGWAKEGGQFNSLLAGPAGRERMKAETLEAVASNGGWDTYMISGGVRGADRALTGRRIDEVAAERGVDPYELACDLLSRGSVSIIGFAMSDANTERILALPYCMIASDGGAARAGEGPGGHPRSFGTFPRAIRLYVREKKLMTLEEMIRKMTSMPADLLGLPGRGRIVEGAAADLAVFDADAIADTATYLESKTYARGVEYLMVNGRLALDGGEPTAALPGRVLIPERA